MRMKEQSEVINGFLFPFAWSMEELHWGVVCLFFPLITHTRERILQLEQWLQWLTKCQDLAFCFVLSMTEVWFILMALYQDISSHIQDSLNCQSCFCESSQATGEWSRCVCKNIKSVKQQLNFKVFIKKLRGRFGTLWCLAGELSSFPLNSLWKWITFC